MLKWRSIDADEISPQTAPILLERFWQTYGTHYHSIETHLLKIMLLQEAVSLIWDMLHDSRLHAEDQQLVLRALLHARFQPRWAWCYPRLGPKLEHQRDETGRIYNNIGVERKKLIGNSLLKDIVNDDSLWHDHPTNVFSYFLGLPDNRDELRAFLNSEEAQP